MSSWLLTRKQRILSTKNYKLSDPEKIPFGSSVDHGAANKSYLLKMCHPRCVESKIQCIKLCVYSYIHTVKTQQISQILSLYNKQHYVIYNNYMFRPCKRAIIRLFTEPSSRLHNRGEKISPP